MLKEEVVVASHEAVGAVHEEVGGLLVGQDLRLHTHDLHQAIARHPINQHQATAHHLMAGMFIHHRLVI